MKTKVSFKQFAIFLLLVAFLQSPVSAAYLDLVNSLNPTAYWRLGESSGYTAYDSSGNNLNGIYQNGVQLGADGAIVSSMDTAAAFDGRNDYALIQHSDDFLLDEGTVQFWVQDTGSIRNDAAMFSKDSSGYDTGGHLTIYTDNGKFNVRLQSTHHSYSLHSDAISLDEWYMVTFTFGSEGMKLYVNDVLVDTDSYTGGLGTTSGGIGNYEPLAIGASTWNSGNRVANPLKNYFSGVIDEVAIYGSAINAQAVSTLYQAGLSQVPEPSTVAILAAGCLILYRKKGWCSA